MAENKKEWLSWVKALILAIIITFIVRTFLFVPIQVEGPSMQPNYLHGDYVMVNKLNYFFNEPERFDVVVFHATTERDYIKRVIGLPGETVEIINDVLYIDGEAKEETYISDQLATLEKGRNYTYNFSLEDLPGSPEVIPARHVLVLGDNRPNSTDSRHLGLVSYDQLVGHASFIYWPLERIGKAN